MSTDPFPRTEKCPFCGSDQNQIELLESSSHNEYAVLCTNCGAFGPNDLGKSGAAEMWDMRRVLQLCPSGHTMSPNGYCPTCKASYEVTVGDEIETISISRCIETARSEGFDDTADDADIELEKITALIRKESAKAK